MNWPLYKATKKSRDPIFLTMRLTLLFLAFACLLAVGLTATVHKKHDAEKKTAVEATPEKKHVEAAEKKGAQVDKKKIEKKQGEHGNFEEEEEEEDTDEDEEPEEKYVQDNEDDDDNDDDEEEEEEEDDEKGEEEPIKKRGRFIKKNSEERGTRNGWRGSKKGRK